MAGAHTEWMATIDLNTLHDWSIRTAAAAHQTLDPIKALSSRIGPIYSNGALSITGL